MEFGRVFVTSLSIRPQANPTIYKKITMSYTNQWFKSYIKLTVTEVKMCLFSMKNG